eukprot:scaffold34923_cov173-Amphora_coffeaeformis.AAC.1
MDGAFFVFRSGRSIQYRHVELLWIAMEINAVVVVALRGCQTLKVFTQGQGIDGILPRRGIPRFIGRIVLVKYIGRQGLSKGPWCKIFVPCPHLGTSGTTDELQHGRNEVVIGRQIFFSVGTQDTLNPRGRQTRRRGSVFVFRLIPVGTTTATLL